MSQACPLGHVDGHDHVEPSVRMSTVETSLLAMHEFWAFLGLCRTVRSTCSPAVSNLSTSSQPTGGRPGQSSRAGPPGVAAHSDRLCPMSPWTQTA